MICPPITIHAWCSARGAIAGSWLTAKCRSKRVRIPEPIRAGWCAAAPKAVMRRRIMVAERSPGLGCLGDFDLFAQEDEAWLISPKLRAHAIAEQTNSQLRSRQSTLTTVIVRSAGGCKGPLS